MTKVEVSSPKSPSRYYEFPEVEDLVAWMTRKLMVPTKDIPKLTKAAFLAAEECTFFVYGSMVVTFESD